MSWASWVFGKQRKKNARISSASGRSSSGCDPSFLPRLELLFSWEGVRSWKTWPKMEERSASWGRWKKEALRTGFTYSCLNPVLKQLFSRFILFWWLFCIFLKTLQAWSLLRGSAKRGIVAQGEQEKAAAGALLLVFLFLGKGWATCAQLLFQTWQKEIKRFFILLKCSQPMVSLSKILLDIITECSDFTFLTNRKYMLH